MANVIPSDTHNVADTGHTTDHNNVADVLGLLAAVLAQQGGGPFGVQVSPPGGNAAAVAALQSMQSTGSGIGFSPWQFPVSAYGAKGDGKIITDAVMTNGSAVLTSAAQAQFTAADVGKSIIVNQGAGGSATNPLLTTILSFQSATQVTLTAACTSAVGAAGGAPVFYATDDTAAINAAVTAGKNFAIGAFGNYEFEVVFANRLYGVAAAPFQSTSPLTYNAQIPLPVPDVTGASRKLIIKFTGSAAAAGCQYWEGVVPGLQGSCLVSFSAAPVSGTFGNESVVGGPTLATGLTGNFANIKPVWDSMTVVCPWNAQGIGLDFRLCASAQITVGSYQAFASVNQNGAAIGGPNLNNKPSNGNSVGLYMPLSLNNDDCFIDSWTTECCAIGVGCGEQVSAQKIQVIYCGTYGLYLNYGNANYDGLAIMFLAAEQCATFIKASLTSTTGTMPLYVGLLATEVLGAGFDIDDPSSTLLGNVNWSKPGGTAPLVNGGTKLRIVNFELGPGVWSGAPAAPATTVTQQNTAYRDAFVFVTSTTTITVAKVDGTTITGLTTATGATMMIPVPAGHTFAVTSGGTITTQWLLL